MTTLQGIFLILFFVSAVVGYFLIKKVPSLLHTPLMSGMNALTGVAVLGALIAVGSAMSDGESANIVATVFGCLAVALATVNAVGGWDVTERMLKMFTKKDK
jgi:NAD(P) transhydrogenase subunit alpha